ncbi:hypothetical protein CHELA20_54513 [Hyphomicrobiales bacterium]|nr:hypothetical protein CHELA41_20413 [Hyphomicrobiales bacterium]CAH1686414.1 hypothetical protein CHELA20_54513 [Hyphomicrobiales bacterium]
MIFYEFFAKRSASAYQTDRGVEARWLYATLLYLARETQHVQTLRWPSGSACLGDRRA